MGINPEISKEIQFRDSKLNNHAKDGHIKEHNSSFTPIGLICFATMISKSQHGSYQKHLITIKVGKEIQCGQ